MSKLLKGTVVSEKMNKTVVVKVEHFKKHPRYGRFYSQVKNIRRTVKPANFMSATK